MKKVLTVFIIISRNVLMAAICWNSFQSASGYFQKYIFAAIWMIFSFVFMFFSRWKYAQIWKEHKDTFRFNHLVDIDEEKELEENLSGDAEFYPFLTVLDSITNIAIWVITLNNIWY